MTSHASHKNSAPGEVFDFCNLYQMKYNKQPLTISEQVDKLQSRGLLLDSDLASVYLKNISYYRLRAYTYPFQNNSDIEMDHYFIKR